MKVKKNKLPNIPRMNTRKMRPIRRIMGEKIIMQKKVNLFSVEFRSLPTRLMILLRFASPIQQAFKRTIFAQSTSTSIARNYELKFKPRVSDQCRLRHYIKMQPPINPVNKKGLTFSSFYILLAQKNSENEPATFHSTSRIPRKNAFNISVLQQEIKCLNIRPGYSHA